MAPNLGCMITLSSGLYYLLSLEYLPYFLILLVTVIFIKVGT